MERIRTKAKKMVRITGKDIIDVETIDELRTEEDHPVDILWDKPKNLVGRPGKFHPYMLEEVEKMAKFGLTNVQIAEFYGIGESTFAKYIRIYPELERALHSGRLEDGFVLQESLHKLALGYEADEYQEERAINKKGEEYIKSRKFIKKHIQPNAGAAQFLLKTRFPNQFSETVKHENTNSTRIDVNINKIDLSGLSMEELMLMKKIGLNEVNQ